MKGWNGIKDMIFIQLKFKSLYGSQRLIASNDNYLGLGGLPRFLGVDSGVAAALALALSPDVPFGTHFCDDPDLLLECTVCGDCFIDPLLAG